MLIFNMLIIYIIFIINCIDIISSEPDMYIIFHEIDSDEKNLDFINWVDIKKQKAKKQKVFKTHDDDDMVEENDSEEEIKNNKTAHLAGQKVKGTNIVETHMDDYVIEENDFENSVDKNITSHLEENIRLKKDNISHNLNNYISKENVDTVKNIELNDDIEKDRALKLLRDYEQMTDISVTTSSVYTTNLPSTIIMPHTITTNFTDIIPSTAKVRTTIIEPSMNTTSSTTDIPFTTGLVDTNSKLYITVKTAINTTYTTTTTIPSKTFKDSNLNETFDNIEVNDKIKSKKSGVKEYSNFSGMEIKTSPTKHLIKKGINKQDRKNNPVKIFHSKYKDLSNNHKVENNSKNNKNSKKNKNGDYEMYDVPIKKHINNFSNKYKDKNITNTKDRANYSKLNICNNTKLFSKEALDRHNELRALEGKKRLVQSNKLCKSAKKWAKHIAKLENIEYEEGIKSGENIAVASGCIDPISIVDMWDGEKESGDYNRAHYAQVVWKATKKFCMMTAMAESGSWYTVARYLPAKSKDLGTYMENVCNPNPCPFDTKDWERLKLEV